MKGHLIIASVAMAFMILAPALVAAPQREEGHRSGSLPAGSRIGIVVLNSSGGNQVDRILGAMLTTAMRRTGVRIIEREEIDAITREQQLVRSGVVDPETAVPAGKVLGVDYMLGVKATEFGVKDDRVGGAVALGPVAGLQIRTSTARVVLDARILDVKTAAVLTTATSEGKQVSHGGTLFGGTIKGRAINLGGIDIGSKEWSESSLGKAARKAVDALVKQIAGSLSMCDGTVLAVTAAGGVVIGLGSFDGIRVGDRMDVIRLDLTRDSKGAVVWSDERAIGRLKITEVKGDRAKAERLDRDLTVREGDLVRKVSSKKD